MLLGACCSPLQASSGVRPAVSLAATGAAVACFVGCSDAAVAADVLDGMRDTLDVNDLGEPSWLLSAADSGGEESWLYRFAGQPGFTLEYEDYMTEDGDIRSAPTKAKLTESGPLLLLGAGATRLGGILPDEMPFNIVQKLLRLIPGVNAILPDLADGDPRKQYQDTWYGTDFKASLPEAMRSRSEAESSSASDPAPPSEVDENQAEKEA